MRPGVHCAENGDESEFASARRDCIGSRMRLKSVSIASCRPKLPTRANRVSLASKLDVPRAAANFRVFADLGEDVWGGIFSDGNSRRNECAELRGAQAVGRRRRNHAVEPAVAAADLESCAGAGLRQHGGRETFGRNSSDRDSACRGDAGGGDSEWRLQRGARIWAGIGGRISDATSGCGCDHIYRRIENRRSHHESSGAHGEAGFV